MKGKKKTKLSKRTAAFLVIAILLFATAGVTGVRAMLNITSENYIAEFELSNLGISLIENGTPVKDLDYVLLTPLGKTYKPGYVYKEEIAAQNVADINSFVRITIRKYWKNANGDKSAELNPALIKLTYNGQPCNTDAWAINDDETTTERTVYYYKDLLLSGETTEPVVNELQISSDVIKKENIKLTEKKEGSKTTYTYEFLYNGYWACVEADVQSLQNHNAQDAVESLWGLTPDDVTVSSPSEDSGSLTLK